MSGTAAVEWHLFHLDFGTAPLHVGSGQGPEAPDKVVQADTLFSALCHAWLDLYGPDDLEGLLERFATGQAPFRLSSAFPRVGESYFLPRPLLPPTKVPAGKEKEVRRAQFLSVRTFQEWVSSGKVDGEQLEQDQHLLEEGIGTYLVPRVALDRVTSASNLFHLRLVVFKPGEAGLYFLTAVADPAILPRLEAAIRLLGEMGLGGRRSVGAGTFTAKRKYIGEEPQWQFLKAIAGNSYCLLSTAVPNAQELPALVERGAWEILDRGGWSRSPRLGRQERRQWVRMLAPGSVFAREPRGTMVDVRPAGWPHPVWRYGLALAVPIEREVSCPESSDLGEPRSVPASGEVAVHG